MLLQDLSSLTGSQHAADTAIACMQELYPLCRSITGNEVRRTLERLNQILPLDRHEVPTGTPIFDWEIPREWNIRDAYIADSQGRRVVDFRSSSLHVVSYSSPIRTRLALDELQEHIHSLPEHPDWIPYRTSYYRETWGFCMRHADRQRLSPGTYEVVVDSDLSNGSLTYGECIVRGQGNGHALLYTHTCHPSLANDNLSGMCALAVVGAALRAARPRLTWHLIFGPGTIGSLAWLARNQALLARLEAGLTVGLLGDDAPLLFKRSRSGTTSVDKAAVHGLRASGSAFRVMDFEPYGYDERQFCSPGFDLPVGRLTRSPNGGYPEYHTSADNLSIISRERIAEAIAALARIVATIDTNRRLVNLLPHGEPRLGKRGLYGNVGGIAPAEFERALLWLLSLGDGRHDLLDAVGRSSIDIETISRAAGALEGAGLLGTEIEVDGASIQ